MSKNPVAHTGLQVTTGGQLALLLVIWLIAEWECSRREKAGQVFGEIIKLPDRGRALQFLLDQARERNLGDLVTLLYRQGAAPAFWDKADPVEVTDQAFKLAAEGNYATAERLYLGALKLDPGLAGAWFNLAVVQARQGKQAEAAGALRKCLDRDPGFSAGPKNAERTGGLTLRARARGGRHETAFRALAGFQRMPEPGHSPAPCSHHPGRSESLPLFRRGQRTGGHGRRGDGMARGADFADRACLRLVGALCLFRSGDNPPDAVPAPGPCRHRLDFSPCGGC